MAMYLYPNACCRPQRPQEIKPYAIFSARHMPISCKSSATVGGRLLGSLKRNCCAACFQASCFWPKSVSPSNQWSKFLRRISLGSSRSNCRTRSSPLKTHFTRAAIASGFGVCSYWRIKWLCKHFVYASLRDSKLADVTRLSSANMRLCCAVSQIASVCCIGKLSADRKFMMEL